MTGHCLGCGQPLWKMEQERGCCRICFVDTVLHFVELLNLGEEPYSVGDVVPPAPLPEAVFVTEKRVA